MKTRYEKFNELGGIDCEIEHPVYGWIPFAASANDPEEHGRDWYAVLSKDPKTLPFDENDPDYLDREKVRHDIKAEQDVAEQKRNEVTELRETIKRLGERLEKVERSSK